MLHDLEGYKSFSQTMFLKTIFVILPGSQHKVLSIIIVDNTHFYLKDTSVTRLWGIRKQLFVTWEKNEPQETPRNPPGTNQVKVMFKCVQEYEEIPLG